MIYKVGLFGASGKMGQEVVKLLSQDLVLGTDSFELLPTTDGPEREAAHVWIDFSRPEGTLSLLEKTDRPVVICTTGFTPDQMGKIETHARKRPILVCPNTSTGIKVACQMLKQTAALADLGFTAVLDEDHHVNKKDKPSGTAKQLLQVLQQAGFADVPVHVTRAGSTVGTHTVRLIADGEEILIQHRVTDRRIFARGALLGAQFLLRQKEPRLYFWEEV